MNKYYKNMILCSELDYHCLLCQETFENIPDVEKHIRWEKHRQCIKHQSNIQKYKEFIHKIGEIYYCEICNYVIKFEALREHIKSDEHIENKANPGIIYKRTALAERDKSGSIKFPKLLVNRLQWHGIYRTECLLCKETIDNINDHLNTTKHMVYIIQNEIIENANYYYRKIEDNIFYCFGCSQIIDNDAINKHSCKKAKGSKCNKNKNNNNENEEKYQTPGFLTLIGDIYKDKYDINVKEKTCKCKLCNTYIDINLKAMSKHTSQYHEDTINYVPHEDHGKRRSELAMYGKENFMKLNKGGSKAYCSLCDIYISAHMKVATQHVNGLRHQGNLEIKGLKPHRRHSVPGCRTQVFQHFLIDLIHGKPMKAVCINYSVCVDELSYMLITTVGHDKQTKKKCFCCDMLFKDEDLNEHCKTRKHRNAFAAADVLLLDEEFVRVIRPGLFHCGYCNQVFPFWETMGKHIASWKHSIVKMKYEMARHLTQQWYVEQETNGAIPFSSELYMQCLELGLLK